MNYPLSPLPRRSITLALQVADIPQAVREVVETNCASYRLMNPQVIVVDEHTTRTERPGGWGFDEQHDITHLVAVVDLGIQDVAGNDFRLEVYVTRSDDDLEDIRHCYVIAVSRPAPTTGSKDTTYHSIREPWELADLVKKLIDAIDAACGVR